MGIEARLRTRAAVCHLFVFTLVGILIGPLLMKLFPEEDDVVFYESHRRGAFYYQGFGLLALLLLALLGPLLASHTDDFTGGAFLAFYWVAYLCAVGVFLLGPVAFAVQAWSGREFDFGPLNALVYGAGRGDSEGETRPS